MWGIVSLYVASKLFDIAVSRFVRWVVRRLYIDGLQDRVLRWLELKKFRVPADALTEKQIVDYQIIRSVDAAVIPDQLKKRIEKQLGRNGLIRKQWDPLLSKPLTFEWHQFFDISASMLAEVVAPSLAELYKEGNIACFVILPFPRDRKVKPTQDFEKALENWLGTRDIAREWLVCSILDGRIAAPWVNRLKEGEGILVLQPMAMNDNYVKRTADYIKSHSMGSIAEVITLVDGSGRGVDRRSKNPPERVLIELNLDQQI